MCRGASLNVAYLFVDVVRLYTSWYERLSLACVCVCLSVCVCVCARAVSLPPCYYFISTRKLPQRSCTLFPPDYHTSSRCAEISVATVASASAMLLLLGYYKAWGWGIAFLRMFVKIVQLLPKLKWGDKETHRDTSRKKTSTDTQTENCDILILPKRNRIK
jgi:hypothetical protein